jgi:outer membrane protein assembly factor BamB
MMCRSRLRSRFNNSTVQRFNCSVFFALAFLASSAHADDWPQWLGPHRDSIWRESGILEKFPAGGPRVLWRAAIGGGYSGPAVAKGRIFLTDRELATGVNNPSDPFQRGIIQGFERVLCFDEATGKLVWQYQYECPYSMSYAAGPRSNPLVSDGKIYTLGGEGNLICLEADSGKPLWQRDLKRDFNAKTPTWGFAGQLLLDGDKLFVLAGGENATIVAFDQNTGKDLWRALNAREPGYSSPIMFGSGASRQLILWDPESANGLDPENGKVLWTEPFPAKSGMSIATPRQMGDQLLFTSFYNGSMMLRIDDRKPQTMWKTQKASEKDTTHLNAVMSTPFLENGYIYGVCSYGQLRCLNAQTGERIWETFKATTDGEPVRWANAFIVKNGDRFFLFNEKGYLIIARLSPNGYDEISRAHLLEPTNRDPGRLVVWSHPAFADRHVYARNDKELVAVDLSRAP